MRFTMHFVEIVFGQRQKENWDWMYALNNRVLGNEFNAQTTINNFQHDECSDASITFYVLKSLTKPNLFGLRNA